MLSQKQIKLLDDEINETRLLMFIEVDPQSNKYRQLLLTQKEFKRVGGSFGVRTPTGDGYENVVTRESDEIYTLPDLQSIN